MAASSPTRPPSAVQFFRLPAAGCPLISPVPIEGVTRRLPDFNNLRQSPASNTPLGGPARPLYNSQSEIPKLELK